MNCTPDWQGLDEFEGLLIQLQKWPENSDLTRRNIVTIGSRTQWRLCLPKDG